MTITKRCIFQYTYGSQKDAWTNTDVLVVSDVDLCIYNTFQPYPFASYSSGNSFLRRYSCFYCSSHLINITNKKAVSFPFWALLIKNGANDFLYSYRYLWRIVSKMTVYRNVANFTRKHGEMREASPSQIFRSFSLRHLQHDSQLHMSNRKEMQRWLYTDTAEYPRRNRTLNVRCATY